MGTSFNTTRVVAGALLSGGVALAGFGPGAGTAKADDIVNVNGTLYHHWCPGDAPPLFDPNPNWDGRVCHNWRFSGAGVVDDRGHLLRASTVPKGPPFNCGLFWCPVPPHS